MNQHQSFRLSQQAPMGYPTGKQQVSVMSCVPDVTKLLCATVCSVCVCMCTLCCELRITKFQAKSAVNRGRRIKQIAAPVGENT